MISKRFLWLFCAAPMILNAGTFSACDVTQDGSTDVADVQRIVNEALGSAAAAHDINQDKAVNVIDVQVVVNAVLGLGCLNQPAPSVTDFNPKTGPAGTLVTLTGTLLISGSGTPVDVRLSAQGGGAISAPEVAVSANSLTFLVPPGAATGTVKLFSSGVTSSSSATFTVTPAASFTVSASPPSASVIRGQTITYTVNLASTNGFTQLAQLGVSGVPAGVSASFKPAQTAVGEQAILTLSVPANQQVGQSTLTITATATIDGIPVSMSSGATLNVLPVTTSFVGRTVVSDSPETSLTNVKVTMLGSNGSGGATPCSGSTFSDGSGNFVLNNLPAGCTGPQLVGFDGTTVTSPAGKYAGVNIVYTLTSGQVTASPVLVHLPRIDSAETFMVQQNSNATQSYSYSSIPGLSLTVYPGTTFTMADGSQPNPFPLAAVRVPVDRLPDLKPPVPTMINIFIVAFQPANVTASQPVAVYYPNPLNTAPGTSMPLLTLDPTKGSMVPYGTGVVSSDGTTIIPDYDPASSGHRYGIVHFDWHGPMPPPPNPNAPDSTAPCGATPWYGDPVNLVTGKFQARELDLPMPGKFPIRFMRILTSGRSLKGAFGVGGYQGYQYYLDTAQPQSAAMFNLVTPDQHAYPFNRQPDGTLTSSGVCTLQGAVMTTASDGSAVLRWSNGEIMKFAAQADAGPLISPLVAISDRPGNTLTFAPDPQNPGNLLSIADQTGRALNFQYDGQGRIVKLTDPIGRNVAYTYDAAGHLASVTHPDGATWQYTWDSQTNNLLTVKDPRNVTIVQNHYDGNGRIIQQVQADNSTINFAYMVANPLVSSSPVLQTVATDQLGNTTTYRFNANGYLIEVLDALGNLRSFNRDPSTNNLLGVSGNGLCDECGVPAQGSITYTYDALGNKTGITDAAGSTETIQYAPGTNFPTIVTDALGQKTTYSYDASGNLTQVKDPLGNATNIAYAPDGNVTQITDPLGKTIKASYDSNGNLVSFQDRKGNVTQISYDAVSRPVAVQDAKGLTATFQYDAKNRILKVNDASGSSVSYTYDPLGNVQTMTDPKGGTLTYTYDSMERLASVKDQTGALTNYTYDAAGNLATMTDRRGQTTRYTYDALNRRTSEQYNDGSSLQRVYDAAGRLVQETDSVAGVFQYQYDVTGHVSKMTTPFGVVSYTRDKDYQLGSRQVEGQPAVNYTRDTRGLITQISAGGSTVNFTYDSRGILMGISRSNGVNTAVTSDADGQITAISHSKGATVLDNQTIGYDSTGAVTDVSRIIGQALTTQTSAATYDSANRPLTFGSRTFTSDAEGNRLTDIGASGNTSFVWDARNRLSSMTTPDGNTWSFLYDPEGNLIQRSVTGNSAAAVDRFLVDFASNIVSQQRVGGEQSIMLTGDDLDSQFGLVGTEGTIGFPLHDGPGNVVGNTDQNGNLVGQTDYEPYGQTSQTGTAYPFAYSARPQFGSLYNMRARYYDPTTGSFLSEDPLGAGGGYNLYAYAGGSPLTFQDPTGENWLPHSAGVEGVVGAEAGARGGASVQASAGIGVFMNHSLNPFKHRIGVWRADGAMTSNSRGTVTGDSSNGLDVQDHRGDCSWVLGASAGIGGGGWLSNAETPDDLSGKFSQININTPILSVSIGWGHNLQKKSIWIGAVTIGKGGGLSASAYKTNTGYTQDVGPASAILPIVPLIP